MSIHCQSTYRPSDRMVAQFGHDVEKHAQDQIITLQHAGGFTAAIVDGANNFMGRAHYPSPVFAATRGLSKDAELNGGEIISSLSMHVIGQKPSVVGADLICALNAGLAREYARIGLVPHIARRGELFTGYIGHVHVAEDMIFVTALGDCRIAVNGKSVAGVEKAVDRLYRSIRGHAAVLLRRRDQEIYAALMPKLVEKQFSFQNNFDYASARTEEFHQELPGLIAHCLGVDPVVARTIVTSAIRDVPDSLAYPAVDGTVGQVVGGVEVPVAGVEFLTIPRTGVHTIVLWTDGYEPHGSRVLSLDDLTLVSPERDEATAIVLTGVS